MLYFFACCLSRPNFYQFHVLDCGINCHKACKGQVVIDCRTKSSSSLSLNSSSEFLNEPVSRKINNGFPVFIDDMVVISALERAATKADAIRNKWKNKKKTRTPLSEQEAMIKEEHIAPDEVDTLHSAPDISDQVRQKRNHPILIELKRSSGYENDMKPALYPVPSLPPRKGSSGKEIPFSSAVIAFI